MPDLEALDPERFEFEDVLERELACSSLWGGNYDERAHSSRS